MDRVVPGLRTSFGPRTSSGSGGSDASTDGSSAHSASERRFILFLQASIVNCRDAFRIVGVRRQPNLYCEVERRGASIDSSFKRLLRTVPVYNSREPKWPPKIELVTGPQADDVLRVILYSRGTSKEAAIEPRRIGDAECTLQQLLLKDLGCHELKLRNDKEGPDASLGSVFVYAEEVTHESDESLTVGLTFEPVSPSRRDRLFVLSRALADGSLAPVYTSFPIARNRPSGAKPTCYEFPEAAVRLRALINGKWERLLRIEVWEVSDCRNQTLLGAASFTLAELEREYLEPKNAEHRTMAVRKTVHDNSVDVGRLRFHACRFSSSGYEFPDFRRNGVVVETAFAIDMSVTNDCTSDAPGHYNNPSGPNEYAAAIRQVGDVLAKLDSTRVFPAWGFGAALPGESEVSHCFPLSDSPVCVEIDGVINAYRAKSSQVAPGKPCHYCGVLEQVIDRVKKEIWKGAQIVYTVMVLMTDGDFSDIKAFSDAVCRAAGLPLSIVLVGIGNAEMPRLEELAGSIGPIRHADGTPCARDIVHFVPFHKHRGNSVQLRRNIEPAISRQALSFFRRQGLRPGDGPSQLRARWAGIAQGSVSSLEGDVARDTDAYRRGFLAPGPSDSDEVDTASQDVSEIAQGIEVQARLSSGRLTVGTFSDSASRPLCLSSASLVSSGGPSRQRATVGTSAPDATSAAYGSLSPQGSSISRRPSCGRGAATEWTPVIPVTDMAMPGTSGRLSLYGSVAQYNVYGIRSEGVYSGPVMQPVTTLSEPHSVEAPATPTDSDFPQLSRQAEFGAPARFQSHESVSRSHHFSDALGPSPGFLSGAPQQGLATPGPPTSVHPGHAFQSHVHYGQPAGGYGPEVLIPGRERYVDQLHRQPVTMTGYAYAHYGPQAPQSGAVGVIGSQYPSNSAPSYSGQVLQSPPVGYPSRPYDAHANRPEDGVPYYSTPRSSGGDADLVIPVQRSGSGPGPAAEQPVGYCHRVQK